MKAIMYHYVQKKNSRPPNYYYLDAADFRDQLDYFRDEYGFVSRGDFLAAVRGELDRVPSGVVLTFDDGLKCHYETVFRELKKQDLWGIFYVPTLPYTADAPLDVHRVHGLLGSVPSEKLLGEVRAVVDDSVVSHEKRTEYRTETYADHNEIETTKQIKRILNYFVDDEHQTAVIDKVIERLNTSPIDTSSFYMSPNELNEMHDDGMIIGGHTVSHPVLSKLDVEIQREEISNCFEFLSGAVAHLSEWTFCYPFGETYTFDDSTISILNDLDCEWCFKVESADITMEDLCNRPLALPRYDCNEFPHGEASGTV